MTQQFGALPSAPCAPYGGCRGSETLAESRISASNARFYARSVGNLVEYVIGPVIKGLKDVHPYVRKTAVMGVLKVCATIVPPAATGHLTCSATFVAGVPAGAERCRGEPAAGAADADADGGCRGRGGCQLPPGPPTGQGTRAAAQQGRGLPAAEHAERLSRMGAVRGGKEPPPPRCTALLLALFRWLLPRLLRPVVSWVQLLRLASSAS